MGSRMSKRPRWVLSGGRWVVVEWSVDCRVYVSNVWTMWMWMCKYNMNLEHPHGVLTLTEVNWEWFIRK